MAEANFYHCISFYIFSSWRLIRWQKPFVGFLFLLFFFIVLCVLHSSCAFTYFPYFAYVFSFDVFLDFTLCFFPASFFLFFQDLQLIST